MKTLRYALSPQGRIHKFIHAYRKKIKPYKKLLSLHLRMRVNRKNKETTIIFLFYGTQEIIASFFLPSYVQSSKAFKLKILFLL